MAMGSFAGKLAVMTGSGSGMGRELTRQLAAQGCSVAVRDMNPDTMAETVALTRPRRRAALSSAPRPCSPQPGRRRSQPHAHQARHPARDSHQRSLGAMPHARGLDYEIYSI